jgi:hypothetical protein
MKKMAAHLPIAKRWLAMVLVRVRRMRSRMDRRGFLRFLGLGAAAAVAAPIIKPKAFFSFFGTGEVYRPLLRTEVLTLADIIKRYGPSERERVDQMLHLIANPPWIGIVDDVPWMGTATEFGVRQIT